MAMGMVAVVTAIVVAIATATIAKVATAIAATAKSARFRFPKMMFFFQSVACSIFSRTTHLFALVDICQARTMSMSHCNKYVATDYVRVTLSPA